MIGWAAGAAIVGGYLSYKGAKANANAAKEATDRSYLATEEGRVWNDQQAYLQRGFTAANTEVQRRDSFDSIQYNIEQEQKKYDSWTAEFGDMRDNLNTYYKELTADSIVGEAHHNLEQSYQLALSQIQNKYAERGISPKSGFYNATEMVLDINKSNQSAQIRSGADDYVRQEQEKYSSSMQNDRYLTRADNMKYTSRNEAISDSSSKDLKDTAALLQKDYANGSLTAEAMKTKMGELYGEQGIAYFNAVGIGDSWNYEGKAYMGEVNNKISSTESSTDNGYNVNYGYKYKEGITSDSISASYKADRTYDYNNDIERYETGRTKIQSNNNSNDDEDNTANYGDTDSNDSGFDSGGDGLGGIGGGDSGFA